MGSNLRQEGYGFGTRKGGFPGIKVWVGFKVMAGGRAAPRGSLDGALNFNTMVKAMGAVCLF